MNESNARIETVHLLGFSLEYPRGETLELAPWQVLAGTTHQTTSADGFTAYVIHRGPSRVQVHFIGPAGITPSWLLCEGSPAVSCSFD